MDPGVAHEECLCLLRGGLDEALQLLLPVGAAARVGEDVAALELCTCSKYSCHTQIRHGGGKKK